MMELFSSKVSYFLSGLGIYLGEKHYLGGDLHCIVGA
jgi:hypothetical protein